MSFLDFLRRQKKPSASIAKDRLQLILINERGEEPIKEYLLLTRYSAKRVAEGEMLSLQDIEDILRIKLIGVIPESESVLQASNQGLPAIHLRDTDVAAAYQDVVSRYLGEELPLRFTEYEKPGLFKRLFGGK